MRILPAVLGLALLPICPRVANSQAAQDPAEGASPPPSVATPSTSGSTDQSNRFRPLDRIVAVVDDDPILASDIQRSASLGLVERRPGESVAAWHRRILDGLIDDRLLFHEVDRFGFQQVPVSAIEVQVEAIESGFESAEQFRAALAEVGLNETGLRQLVARQLVTLTYLEQLLGPRVFVALADIRAYYEETLVPELEARGEAVPPIEEVREDIRGLLKEVRLSVEIEKKIEALRQQADVVDLFDREENGLPPVVWTIE